MLNIFYLLPSFLMMLVLLNRYFFGKLLLSTKQFFGGSTENPWQPRVGVVIPLYNEGYTIYETIKSIALSTYPKELLEIWVVDDCSQDDSFVWATKAASEFSNVKVVRNPTNLGKRRGIARAVRLMDTEVVLSIDSDVMVSPYAIEILLKNFTAPNVAAVGGKVAVSNADTNVLTRMQAIKYWVGYEFLKNLENAFDTVMCLSGCLTAYRRSVLLEVEPLLENRNILGIPIKYGEDRYLTRMIVKKGYKTKLNLQAICYTKAPATLAGYFSQQLRWRRSNIVDFLGGISHIWYQHPLVALHYLSLYSLMLCYPVVLWQAALRHSYAVGFLLHLALLSILGFMYFFSSEPQFQGNKKVHPANFLLLAFVLPVTYMVISILALFTLDSGSWETRKKST